MTDEEKLFHLRPMYDKLSDKQKQEFKKALFLSKGGVNNEAGGTLAMMGLPSEDIVKYGTGWKSSTGEELSRFMPIKPNGQPKNKQERLTRKLLIQQSMRIPELFDTTRGRALVAKYGEEVKDEFCNKLGKCPLSVVSFGEPYERMLNRVEFVNGAATEWTFKQVKRKFVYDFDVQFNATKALRLEFLMHTNASTIARAKSKNVDLWEMFEQKINSTGYRLEDFPEFKKDFWTFINQDFEALANAPGDITQKLGIIEENKPEGVQTIATLLGGFFTKPFNAASMDYSTSPSALYNPLYIRAMYTAMDEMGVGIGSSIRLYVTGSKGKLSTSIKKTAKKVISLNEKYQKMLKSKSNTIEPAILRQTIVGMFNEYADRSFLRFRMFIREDRPAPTLASLKPTKKSTKATTTQTSKHSTGQKRVVTDDEGHKFVEY